MFNYRLLRTDRVIIQMSSTGEYVNVIVQLIIAGYKDEAGHHLGYWSEDRYSHIISLRQEALENARASWSDYLLVCKYQLRLPTPIRAMFAVLSNL